MLLTHTLYERIPGEFVIILPNGNFAQTTQGECFITGDRSKADAALAYLAQPAGVSGKRVGARWLKSTFGDRP